MLRVAQELSPPIRLGSMWLPPNSFALASPVLNTIVWFLSTMFPKLGLVPPAHIVWNRFDPPGRSIGPTGLGAPSTLVWFALAKRAYEVLTRLLSSLFRVWSCVFRKVWSGLPIGLST